MKKFAVLLVGLLLFAGCGVQEADDTVKEEDKEVNNVVVEEETAVPDTTVEVVTTPVAEDAE